MDYKYHAKTVKGEDKVGVIEAITEEDAVNKLHAQGLVVISVQEIKRRDIYFKKEKEFPWIVLGAVSLLVIIFSVGIFIRNSWVRERQSEEEVFKIREGVFEKILLDVRSSIISNKDLSLIVATMVATTWQKAIKSRKDFNIEITKVLKNIELEGIKSEAEERDAIIEAGMRLLNKLPDKNKEAYDALLEAYSTYSQIYALAFNPFGSLKFFNRKINDLESKFDKELIKLKFSLTHSVEENTVKSKE